MISEWKDALEYNKSVCIFVEVGVVVLQPGMYLLDVGMIILLAAVLRTCVSAQALSSES
jgi:hypothetical protein